MNNLETNTAQPEIRNIYEARRVTPGKHGGGYTVNWLFEESDFATQLLAALLVEVPPAGEIGDHPHDHEELYLVLDASGEIDIDGRRASVKRGDLILTHPGHRHKLVNHAAVPMHVFIVSCKAAVSHPTRRSGSRTGRLPAR